MTDVGQVTGLAARVRGEVAKAVVGQDAAVTGLLIGLLTGGHVLLEGVPGTAKTLLARTLAYTLDASFKRIQFSPDLMPADVVGTNVFELGRQEFTLRQGPIFANLLLADEINRTPPKTQSALLEAMQERQVTIDGVAHALPDPFLVIATQNPVEYEGTYPLPEAQLDRFEQKIVVGYPDAEQEAEILRRHVGGLQMSDIGALGVQRAASTADIIEARGLLDAIVVDDAVVRYTSDVCRATRDAAAVILGASPRAAVSLLVASKAHAMLAGRDFVTPDDVKAMAPSCLRHRILLRPEVEIEGMDVDTLLGDVLGTVAVPR
jgi:MoxR-like ATPase